MAFFFTLRAFVVALALGLLPGPLEGLETKYPYVDGILVVQHGEVVYEKTRSHDYASLMKGKPGMYNYRDPAWHPVREGLHTVQSITKTVTGALIGIAIRRGEIPSVDVPVAGYIKGLPGGIRLRHLLTMTAGLQWDEEKDWPALEADFDWIRFVTRPLAGTPGQDFNYSSGTAVLLGEVLRRATGDSASAYAVKHLWKPLGVTSAYWKSVQFGVVDTQGGLYLRPLDLARFGELYLRDSSLLGKGWVKASTTPWVSVPDDPGWKFGYQWWLLPYGRGQYAYTAMGYGGQRLFVIPEYDAVAVFTGWNVYDRYHYLPVTQALERVLESLR